VIPNAAPVLRWAGEVLIEQHDEGAGKRCYLLESSMLELAIIKNLSETFDAVVITPGLTAA